MDHAAPLPSIGSTVTVCFPGDSCTPQSLLKGNVTSHDTKDGNPVFGYETSVPLRDGRVVQTTKWAWLDQVVDESATRAALVPNHGC